MHILYSIFIFFMFHTFYAYGIKRWRRYVFSVVCPSLQDSRYLDISRMSSRTFVRYMWNYRFKQQMNLQDVGIHSNRVTVTASSNAYEYFFNSFLHFFLYMILCFVFVCFSPPHIFIHMMSWVCEFPLTISGHNIFQKKKAIVLLFANSKVNVCQISVKQGQALFISTPVRECQVAWSDDKALG